MKYLSIKILYVVLTVLLVIAVLLSVGIGGVKIAPMQTIAIIGKTMGIHSNSSFSDTQEAVLLSIRLPRVILGMLTGASLAIAGASMQGLFRNPLADPGLIGISSGASMTAVIALVAGAGTFAGAAGFYLLSGITFLGALITAVIVYRLSLLNGRVIISTMLLAGIAINALTSAVTGVFTYSANDAQLRSITFWMLGSLGGASWTNVTGLLPFTIIPVLLLPRMGKALNAFSLGEETAVHLGVRTERTKQLIILLATLCVGATVAVTGVISFVGLVIPHIIRMIAGPDHRYTLGLSALAGATLLTLADLISRTLLAPAEVPIGIITSLTGAPFFMYILIKEKKQEKLV
ncbi:FecCD family ABC transporter permease [Taibaiella soli]|uniref:Iron ABC transporter permease n=1 Tax=Taibaiella soli TaxID=1649169 RepID=A0A2W2BKF9_9BACT|nr:iron ABC transporter permease [Taibaiella soli]PZF73946.1 iron ABC transporter permease [Taibaiella soli]